MPGYYGATGGMAAVVGQLAGGLLVAANIAGTGWRPIFLVNVPIGLPEPKSDEEDEVEARTRSDGGQYGIAHRPTRRQPEVLTDGQRITRMRQDLEARLAECGDQAERAKLIDAHNARVRRMNIRYRRTGLYRESDSPRARS